MEPIVIEGPSSEELVNNQSQIKNNGVVGSSVALTQHNLSRSFIPGNQTSCGRTHTTNDGLVTNFGEQKSNDNLRTSQVHDEQLKRLKTESVPRVCSGRSFCHNFLMDSCSRGAACPDLHNEYTTFITPGYEWCIKLHQEILKSKKPVIDSCNRAIVGSDSTSTCGKPFASPVNADASVLTKDSNSSRSTSLTHEGGDCEKSVEVKQVVELPCKKKRKKCSMSTNGSLDSATACLGKKAEGECAKEANLCLEKTLHQEIPTKSENLIGDSCNLEISGSDPASTSGKTSASPMDADVSVINDDTNSSRSISLNHEGSEKSVDVQQAEKSPGKKKRKRGSKDTNGSLDPATVVLDKKTEGGCASEATLNLEKKLLVLDLNGILVDIVPCHRGRIIGGAVATLAGKAVFRRRFCEDFLDFCFEKFNVGVWSSRQRKNIDKLINLLFGEKKKKLLFCWDDTYCTETGVKTLENKAKPLVLKELKTLWEKDRPEVPWDKGHFNETNTVLLDDSPYKALRNPPYTAIFPSPFSYRTTDNSLGRDGELRQYLTRLAEADNVQKFIQENPFGQISITESDVHWGFYAKIITPKTPTVRKKKWKDWKKNKKNKQPVIVLAEGSISNQLTNTDLV